MGLFSSLLGVAAPIAGGIFGGPAGAAIGGALGGALGASNAPKSQTTTATQQLDPRLQSILYGQNGQGGLLSQIAAQAQGGAGQQAFGQGIDSYLGGWGTDNFMRSQQNSQRLQETVNAAPQAVNTQGVGVNLINAAQVNAPSQNGLDLSPAYDRFINGNAGENPYLLNSLKAGSDLANAQYKNNVNELTNTLQRQVLPSIRGGALASGQFGSSRQGIAEGNALSDYTKQLTNANTQLGLGQQAGILGAQANAFNQGQDRSLNALQGLSGQQYGVAQQNAQLAQQANLANQNAFQNAETTNAGLRQGVNLANLQAQLGTIQQNDARNASGIGLSSGLLGQAANYANNNLNRLGQAAGYISPFTGYGGVSSQTNPLYSNAGASALGGAGAALGLYNQLSKGNSGGTDLFRLFGGLNGTL